MCMCGYESLLGLSLFFKGHTLESPCMYPKLCTLDIVLGSCHDKGLFVSFGACVTIVLVSICIYIVKILVIQLLVSF